MGRLDNKTALITGAATGIGKAIALCFAAEGAVVTVDYVEYQEEKAAAVVAELEAEIPLGRMGHADEVAGLALYLASDAAAYVTGSTYFIDGGMIRQSGSL